MEQLETKSEVSDLIAENLESFRVANNNEIFHIEDFANWSDEIKANFVHYVQKQMSSLELDFANLNIENFGEDLDVSKTFKADKEIIIDIATQLYNIYSNFKNKEISDYLAEVQS
jgi:hypothetical protein